MIVVDASVAVKWFVQEHEHEAAIAIVNSGEELIAPDLIIAEVMNVLRRKRRQDLISIDQLTEAAGTIAGSIIRFIPATGLVVLAASLSEALDHSIYDCFYLACATMNGCALLTADSVFADKVVSKGYADVVLKLADWDIAYQQRSPPISSEIFQTVMELYERFNATLESVRKKVSRSLSSSGTVKLVNSGDLAPAFGSPAYVKLVRYITSLNKSERARLLALGWFGQDQLGSEWSLVLDRAEAYLTDDPSQDLPYLLSKIPLFEKGMSRLKGWNPDQLIALTSEDKT